jgi:hypothetical protein
MLPCPSLLLQGIFKYYNVFLDILPELIKDISVNYVCKLILTKLLYGGNFTY